MQKKTRILWVLASCVAAYCVISAWIVFTYPGRVLDLLSYFTYMTLACTVLPLPTHGIVMDYAERFNPCLVAILGGIGTSMSALIDYVLLVVIFRYTKIDRIKTTRNYLRIERLFKKSGFITILVMSLAPIPLELAKVLGCITRYNIIRFLLAIFLGRGIRYYLLGVLQEWWLIPRIYLYGSILVLLAIEVARRLLMKSKICRVKRFTAKSERQCKIKDEDNRRDKADTEKDIEMQQHRIITSLPPLPIPHCASAVGNLTAPRVKTGG